MKCKCLQAFACLFTVAALLLSTTGCEPFNTSGKSVNFSASTSVTTKAAYGPDADGKQMIAWQEGDQIRIASDYAQQGDATGIYSALYTVVSVDNSQGPVSRGKIRPSDGDGLCWDPQHQGRYQFFAYYPDNNVSFENVDYGIIQASLPEAEYLMVASTGALYGENLTVLSFYPAFTAFKVTINTDNVPGASVTSCSLSSSTDNLSGSFQASIQSSGISGYQALNDQVKTSSPSIREGSTFTFFCLPTDLTNLTFTCTYVVNGQTVTKSLKLNDSNGSPYVFTACHQHRLTATLIDSGGNISIDVTLGGGQLLLKVLANKKNAWPNTMQEMVMDLFGIDHNNPWWGNERQDEYNNFWNSLSSKIDSYRNVYSQADRVFREPGFYFTSDELSFIKRFLETVTSTGALTDEPKIQSNISDSDFNALPNLSVIDELQADQNSDLSIEILNRNKLTSVTLEYWSSITLKGCDGMDDLVLKNIPNNNEGYISIENCHELETINIGNLNTSSHFHLGGMPLLTYVELGEAKSVWLSDCPLLTELKVNTANRTESLTIENCPEFTTYTLKNAGSLETITLSSLPKFQSGMAENCQKNVHITLSNCSTAISGTAVIDFSNYNATLSCTRDANSDHVVIYRSGTPTDL